MDTSPTSNYEQTKHRVRQVFLDYDQEKMIQKFSLRSDDNYLYLHFFSRLVRINRSNGLIEHCCSKTDDGAPAAFEEADFNEAMTIYDILCDSKDGAKASGEYTALQNLSQVQNASSYAGNGMFFNYEKLFDQRDNDLSEICRLMGGVPQGKGDVAYKIPVFGDLCMLFQFWDSDDEFPPSLTLLCDKNNSDFMHYETAWYMVCHLLERISDGLKK